MKSSTLLLIVGAGAAYLILSGRRASAAPAPALTPSGGATQASAAGTTKWDVVGQGVSLFGDILKNVFGMSSEPDSTVPSGVAGL